jgi:hypothetical protein
MGCCISRRPHANSLDANDLQKAIEAEENYLQDLIFKNNNNLDDTNKLNFINRLHLIKSSLTQLHYKIEKNKEKINDKKNNDWKTIMEIMDDYSELKEQNFIEKSDLIVFKNDKDKSDRVDNENSTATKKFFKKVDDYVGHDAE